MAERALAAGDPRLVPPASRMSTLVGGREPVALGQRDAERVVEQVGALERRVGRRRGERVLLREREVELAELERGQAVLGLHVARGDAQVGVALGERGDRAREQHAVRARERRAAQDAGDVRGGPLERRLGRLELAQDALRALHQLLAGGREAAAAAVALEQRDAGLALERGELLGDRRGGVAERVGGGRDRPAGGELAQDAEAADVEHAKAQLTLVPRDRNWKFAWSRGHHGPGCAPSTSPSPSWSPRCGA